MVNNPSYLFQPFAPSPKTDIVLTSSPLQLPFLALTRRFHLPRLNQPVAISIMTTCPEKSVNTITPPFPNVTPSQTKT